MIPALGRNFLHHPIYSTVSRRSWNQKPFPDYGNCRTLCICRITSVWLYRRIFSMKDLPSSRIVNHGSIYVDILRRKFRAGHTRERDAKMSWWHFCVSGVLHLPLPHHLPSRLLPVKCTLSGSERTARPCHFSLTRYSHSLLRFGLHI